MMDETDTPEPLSIDQWREREARRQRRSLAVFSVMALALSFGLIYVVTR